MVLARITDFSITLSGHPQFSLLPTSPRALILDAIIEGTDPADGGDGVFLTCISRDGSVNSSTWHQSTAAAREQAEEWFRIPRDAWRPSADARAAG